MEWRHIRFEDRQIEVPASAAKPTRGRKRRVLRRLVPIQPNLEQWLAPYSQSEGKIWRRNGVVSKHSTFQFSDLVEFHHGAGVATGV